MMTLNSTDILALQQDQFQHDRQNHTDIIFLHKNDKLKHYGLHFSKYVGRLARGKDEKISVERTIIDCALISLSAANTLSQKLKAIQGGNNDNEQQFDGFLSLADAAGRFSDACEKIDHMEECLMMAETANQDIFEWVLQNAAETPLNLQAKMKSRRSELAERQFFIRA